MKLTYTVTDRKYDTIRQLLKEEFKISDRLLLTLKKQDFLYQNGNLTTLFSPLLLGDTIEIDLTLTEDISHVIPNKMDLSILYEDDSLLVLQKPPYLPVHPSREHYQDSLSNGVSYYFKQINLQRKIRPVNRLDKDTSGVIVFAKHAYIQECLIQQMQHHIFQKEYIAIVEGMLEEKEGTLTFPIARKSGSIIEREVSFTSGSHAITHYRVCKEKDNMSQLQVILETGRTHQIRVHTSYIGHPIVGDTLYGKASCYIARQALHSYKIHFLHPITKQEMNFIAPLPKDMKKLL